jgi:hypothetical protein
LIFFAVALISLKRVLVVKAFFAHRLNLITKQKARFARLTSMFVRYMRAFNLTTSRLCHRHR